MCYLKVLMNGAVIYVARRTRRYRCSPVLLTCQRVGKRDPDVHAHVHTAFGRYSADTFASDVQVMVIKKQTLGITWSECVTEVRPGTGVLL